MSDIHVNEKLIIFLIFMPLFLLSLAIHEFAHAFTANKFGDDTAKRQGRLTLNPFKHIDLIGSVILPILSFFSGFALIGWAKPVPVDRRNLKDPLMHDAVISAAGPFSNLMLAFVFMIILNLAANIQALHTDMVISVIGLGVYFNVFLFAFNLLPIPPLDGSHILFDIFPNKITAKLLNLGIYGTILLFLFIYSPLWDLFMKFVDFILQLFFMIKL